MSSTSLLDLVEFCANENQIDDESPSLFKESNYFDNDYAVEFLKEKSNVFSIISLNCQSLNAKIDQLRLYLSSFDSFQFSAIALQETWLTSDADVSLLQINGYTLISRGRSCSAHGGVAIYLRSDLSYRILDVLDNEQVWDGLFIEVSLNGKFQSKKLIIGNIYRPPRENVTNYRSFTEDMNRILCDLQRKNHEALVCGDFNIDLLKINERPMFNEYFETFLSNGFIPKISLPTRLNQNSSTLIDNIYLKLSDNFSNSTAGIMYTNISDHLPCFITLDYLTHPVPHLKYVKITNKSDDALSKFKNELYELCTINKFNSQLDCDPNENYEIMHGMIQHCITKHLPTKLLRYNKYKHKKTKWITRGLLHSIRFRDKLYKRVKNAQPNSQEYETLKTNLNTYNNILRKSIRLAKRSFYESCFLKFKNDIKQTWITIKNILNKNSVQNKFPEYFLINGKHVSDPGVIANSFNMYYTNIGPDLAASIVPPLNKCFDEYLTSPVSQEFNFQLTNSTIVGKIIENLKPKTSVDIDGMSSKLLKYIQPIVTKPLTLIINQMITTGIFPQKLKEARVIPLYKKNENFLIENYRPVSILPPFSKVAERVMHDQLYNHFHTLKLFYASQYGFRTLHSTELATLELIDRITNSMDAGEVPINIYIDLSKAFDTLDHHILLTKLQYYGVHGNSLSLFQSYLNNRKQSVYLNDICSQQLCISTGVPQGSILGPLLFIIYINDISKACNLFYPVIYADDTTLSATLNTFSPVDNQNSRLDHKINDELMKILDWLKVNKLSLNINKTKAMLFHAPQKQVLIPDIKIGGTVIEFVDKFDFLGIVLDKHLNFKQHISKILFKISKTVGVMNKLKHFLPSVTLLTIYQSLIMPHLNYGILVWGSQHRKLEKVQKRAVRVIVNGRYNSHTEPIFKNLQLLKLHDLCALNDLKFCYKYLNGMLPSYFTSMFVRHSEHHSVATRFANNFQIPLVRHSFAQNSIRYKIPVAYNNCELRIKDKFFTHSITGFSNYVKNIFIEKYNRNCWLENCYVCQFRQ